MGWNVVRQAIVGGVILLTLPVLAANAAAAPAGKGATGTRQLRRAGRHEARPGPGHRRAFRASAQAVAHPRPAQAADPDHAGGAGTAADGLRPAPPPISRRSPWLPRSSRASAARSPLQLPGQSGLDVVRAFLHANRALYGLTGGEIDALHFRGESVSPRNGMRMVRVEQRINDHSVFQSDTRFILDRSGRVWRSLGLLMPNAANAAAPPLSLKVSAPQALASAMRTVGLPVDAAHMAVTGANADGTVTQVIANDPRIVRQSGERYRLLPGRPRGARPGLAADHLHPRRRRLVHGGRRRHRHPSLAQEHPQPTPRRRRRGSASTCRPTARPRPRARRPTSPPP